MTKNCSTDFEINSSGVVNIYNCSDSCGGGSTPEPCDCPNPPGAPGACVPLALGAKPKQSRQRKLQKWLAGSPGPSALAASYFHLARRFLNGKQPANSLEAQAFDSFRSLSPDLRRVLACSLDSLDSLSGGERERLFLSSLMEDLDKPIEPEALAEAVGEEVALRASQAIFDDPHALEQERPGKNRYFDPGGEFFEPQLRICKVNGLRTNEFKPALGPGDYTPQELQQHCEPVLVGEEVQLNCEIQVDNCPGNFLSDRTCLRVPEVEAGQAVVLEGVGYISVDSKVRIVAQPPGTASLEVDAHVFGDIDTPVDEVVDGETRRIFDCRVHDRLTFRLPDDLAPGIYSIQVAVPNVSGIPIFGDTILSNFQFLQVVPPATARFQIASETLVARKETSPAFFGSDEVGLSIVSAALFEDGTTGPLQVLKGSNGKNFLRFDNVDSGDSFPIPFVLFSHQQNILGMALSITGYEIDSEDAFENQVTDSITIFLDILKKEWDFIKAALDAAGGYQALKGLGLKVYIAIGIAILIALAIDLVIALWAPADPIIQDAFGFTTVDLAALTSANFPAPAPAEFPATDDISVKVTPLDKIPQQFSERREYSSEDEDSRYELTLRYNRLA